MQHTIMFRSWNKLSDSQDDTGLLQSVQLPASGGDQMSLQFRCAVDGMDVWSATSGGLSFVITYASLTGNGFRGRPGYVASWRPHYVSKGAIKIGGSPFKTFADAEDACNAMRDHLSYVPKIPIYEKDTPTDYRVPARE